MQYTSHVKSGHLKNLIQQPISCEEKLKALEQLLGLPPGSAVNEEGDENGEQPMVEEGEGTGNELENERQAALEVRNRSFARITADLSGQERKIAFALLTRIEAAENIGWDFESDEIILSNERLLHSSMKTIIEKIVVASSPILPIGLIRFIDALIKIKIPLNYIQNSDALNIRLGLLTISNERRQDKTEQPNEVGGTTVEEQPMIEGIPPPEDLQILNVGRASREYEAGATTAQEEPMINEIPATAGAPPEDLQILNVRKRVRETDSEDEREEQRILKTAKKDIGKGKALKKGAKKTSKKPTSKNSNNSTSKKSSTVAAEAQGLRRSKRLALRSDLTDNWTPISRN